VIRFASATAVSEIIYGTIDEPNWWSCKYVKYFRLHIFRTVNPVVLCSPNLKTLYFLYLWLACVVFHIGKPLTALTLVFYRNFKNIEYLYRRPTMVFLVVYNNINYLHRKLNENILLSNVNAVRIIYYYVLISELP